MSIPIRPRRQRRSGVALLVAITTVMLLTILVSELSYNAQVRMVLAYNQRDRAQAYWLARSRVVRGEHPTEAFGTFAESLGTVAPPLEAAHWEQERDEALGAAQTPPGR